MLGLVREALEHLGGIAAFVKPGQTVLIKPNQTVYYSAEDGCTTDPLVVGALIRLAKQAGAVKVQVGESSGGYFRSIECMRITGMAAIAEREGAELIDLGSDKTPNRVVGIPDGVEIREAPLPAPLLDADVVIAVPKAKNHHIEPISGALKLWVGAVNQTWRDSHHGDNEMIPRFLDLMCARRPELCITDAIIIGEGDGPIANQPRWCGVVLASADPVATDVTIARLLGHDPDALEFARQGEKRGLGVRSPIEYLGVPLEQVSIRAWAGHQDFDYLPLNLLVGSGVTLAGTIGHVKSVLDSMLRRGELNEVIWLRGTPTIMIGEVDDPLFEQHLKDGPYVVFDDAAKPEYKRDPRVHFVSGHPVLRSAMQELMKGLGVSLPGNAVMRWQQARQRGMHSLQYGTPMRKAATAAETAGAMALTAGGLLVGAAALGKLFSRPRKTNA